VAGLVVVVLLVLCASGSSASNGRASPSTHGQATTRSGMRLTSSVFALDRSPAIATTANVRQFLAGIKESVLASGLLTGIYGT
jgi:hypothetical protein